MHNALRAAVLACLAVLSAPAKAAEGAFVIGREYNVKGLHACSEREASDSIVEAARSRGSGLVQLHLLLGMRLCGRLDGRVKFLRLIDTFEDTSRAEGDRTVRQVEVVAEGWRRIAPFLSIWDVAHYWVFVPLPVVSEEEAALRGNGAAQ